MSGLAACGADEEEPSTPEVHVAGAEGQDKREHEKRENERREQEKRENERREQEKREQEKREHERREHERREHERREHEKREHEKREKERIEKERIEREKEEQAKKPRFSIGGQVSGLASGRSLTLRTTSGEELAVNVNGAFRFFNLLRSGETYQVAIARQPLWQFCEIKEGVGQAASAISSVVVQCADAVAEVSTLAGSGAGAADGQGADAAFYSPYGLAADAQGAVYVSDSTNSRIRKITTEGEVTTLAGSGRLAFADGDRAAASFNNPTGTAVDRQGNLYVADQLNHRIRRITPEGQVTTLAGSGKAAFAEGQGAGASFNQPLGVAVDRHGHVYVADPLNHRIRKITPEGEVTTFAGSGQPAFADGQGAAASFKRPAGVAVDLKGQVYIADHGNHRIRKITPEGKVTTLAGSARKAFADGQGADASFNGPRGVAVDRDGHVYVADYGTHRIRRITPDGHVTTLAGSGKAASSDGWGEGASFKNPAGVAMDLQGHLYVADGASHRIRKISPVKAR